MKNDEQPYIIEMLNAYKKVGYEHCEQTNTLSYPNYALNLCVSKAYKEWKWAKQEIKEIKYHKGVNNSLTSALI